ncbi:MAG: cell division protein FtsL [Deltaproteobacteria bacterium]|nr:cell division protein FtsL [Deltaproteobacteria bacterium]
MIQSRTIFQTLHHPIRRGNEWGLSLFQKKRLLKDFTVLIVSLMVCSLFYVWSRIQTLEKGYRLGELRKTHDELKEIYHSLSLEAATLKSPQRLETIGRERFGLVPPRESQLIFLSETTGLGGDPKR